MRQKHIGLVTYDQLPDLDPGDRLLLNALLERGHAAVPLVWDRQGVEWAGLDLCVIRSTWDYHLRYEEFVAWVQRVRGVTRLWNQPDLLIWNSHKTYLRELAGRGIPVVPTEWVAAGSRLDLGELLRARGWTNVVIKPAVSADAYETKLAGGQLIERGQEHLDRLSATRDVMIQPFLPSVHTYGERSLIFVDGRFSHAVTRQPRAWQLPDSVMADDQGNAVSHGHATVVNPSDAELSLAEDVIHVAAGGTLYARVDLVLDESGQRRLLELELIEPSLFLEHAPHGAERMAAGIERRLEQSRDDR